MTGDFESEYDTWQVILPQEGLKYTFLLDGFLALAALELAAIPNQPNYARYVSFALEYHDNGEYFHAHPSSRVPQQRKVYQFTQFRTVQRIKYFYML